MPSPRTAKTKWALSLLAVACILLAGIALFSLHPHSSARQQMVVNGHRYMLDVAATDADQQRGLGGRSGLAAAAGMLFVFPRETTQCFWMKDMRFAIDMVWVNAHKQVGAIEANVSPATYPKSYCHPGQYVIELGAGQAASAGMRTGTNLGF